MNQIQSCEEAIKNARRAHRRLINNENASGENVFFGQIEITRTRQRDRKSRFGPSYCPLDEGTIMMIMMMMMLLMFFLKWEW